MHKEEFRNTTEPYIIKLYQGCLKEHELRSHIDNYIFTYKQWEAPQVEFLSNKNGWQLFSNKSFNLKYELTLQSSSTELKVCCSCNRKVEKLCHHTYHALHLLIKVYGQFCFANNKLGNITK